MSDRPYIKLDVRGQLPTIIYIDQISSVVSLGILGTKVVLKEVNDGRNVEHVFPLNFEVVEDKIARADTQALYKR